MDVKNGVINLSYVTSDFISKEKIYLNDEAETAMKIAPTDTNSNGKRNGHILSSNRKKERSRPKPSLNGWIFMERFFLVLLEKHFESFARKIALNPWKVIILTFGLSCLFGVGLVRLTVENRIEKLYVPSNTKSENALHEGKPYFINSYNSRQEEVIFLPKPGKSIFSNSCLTFVDSVIKQIVSIPSYRKLCKQKSSFVKKYKQYNRDETCMIINPLELLRGSIKRNDTSVSLAKALGDKETLMSNGKPAALNLGYMFSDYDTLRFTKTSENSIRVIFFMQQAESGLLYDQLLDWEKMFIGKLKELNKDQACVEITFAAERSMSDSVSESTRSDIPLMSITFTIMIFIAVQINGSKTNSIRGHSLLTMLGVCSSALSVLAGFGLVMAFGVPFISIVGILPFLVVSIGIDDVFIIIHEFEKMPEAMPANRRVSHAIAKVGATITMTTLTDIIVFAIGISSSFPAVKYFCIFAAVTFTAEYLLQMTLFIALLSLDARRMKAGKRDCLPFCRGEDRELRWKWKEKFSPRKIMNTYGNLLLKWPSRLFILLLVIAMTSAGIYGYLNISHEFSRKLLAKSGTYYRRYLDVVEKHFLPEIDVSLIQTGQTNYTSFQEQNKIIAAPNLAYSSGYYLHRNSSWMASFQLWANINNITITENNLLLNLNTFLSIPKYSFFNDDVVLDGNKGILASRIHIYMKASTSSSFHKNAMLQLRKVLSDHDQSLTPMSNLFIYFEQYVVITDEVIRNLLCAAGTVALVTALFCTHPLIAILIVLGLFVLAVQLFGMMYFWNVSLNSISMLNLVMAIGFSVDYSAHFAHAFSTSNKHKVDDRILDALSTVGWSILMGGLSTFLGILALAFSSSDIFQIFFRMFLGIAVFGLFDGLVLLPVLVSLLGSFFRGVNSFQIPDWALKKYSDPVLHSKTRPRKRVEKKSDNQKLISVVGIATRFPTAKTKDQFWELLLNGRRTLSEYPENRRGRFSHFKRMFNPSRPMMGRMYVTKGSFLEDIDLFDHQFFGISAREAKTMDPQQRLILQNVFEAIEDAGLRLEDLQNCRTGVYVGIMNWDYDGVIRSDSSLLNQDQFTGTGVDPSLIPNRISFALNFTGPSLFVDTACSSSLSALSIAYDHLKSGRCDIAIVSAANILLDTVKHIAICQANMLASDGQSKSFDAAADGYGRGEGIASVILKPSFTAVLDGDNIYCDILSCGVNSDGRGAIPITAPSIQGQQDLCQEVLASSGIRADAIQYVEAHGTGTIIGDRVETESIANVYSCMRPADNPLRIGSVKSNINHTESVAGLAGLIKVCLMMKHKKFVPTVGIENLNPALQTEERKIKVQQTIEDWVNDGHNTRTAAVNSFGYGGSNGHVIVQEGVKKMDKKKEGPTSVEKLHVLVLSAYSVPSLKETARKFGYWLSGLNEDNTTALDVSYSLYKRRTHHDHRIAVGFENLIEAADLLQRYAENEIAGKNLLRLTEGKKFHSPSKVGFVFGGQGSSRPGVIKQLRQNKLMENCFQRVQREISSCNQHLSIFNEDIGGNQTNVKESQALTSLKIFAVEYAVAQVLIEKTGIYPLAVAGHSLGDISAACISGYISLQDAVKMIIIRSSLQEECTAEGSMMAVGMSVEEIEDLIHELNLDGKVVVAGKNDKNNVTLSGDSDAVAEIEQYLRGNRPEIFCRTLKVNKAFHSHHLDSLKEDFFDKVNPMKLGEAKKRKAVCFSLYSTVKGKRVSYHAMSTQYFWENMRNPVLFNDAIEGMLADGIRILIEISPVPILSRYLGNIVKSTSLGTDEDPVYVIQGLPRLQEPDLISHLYIQCIARLFTLGYPICWDNLFDYSKSSFIQYPLYAWQETRHWFFEMLQESDNATRLLGKLKANTTSNGISWENDIECFTFSYMSGHQLSNMGPVFPGAGYVEMAMEAIIGGPYLEPTTIEDISFTNILTLPSNTFRSVETSMLLDETTNKGKLEIFHLGPNGQKIVLSHAAVEKVNCSPQKEKKSFTVHDLSGTSHYNDSIPDAFWDLQDELTDCIDEQEFAQMTIGSGFEYSGDFKLIDKVWRSSDKALCRVKLTESVKGSLGDYVLHPAIIDVCFQSCIPLLATDDNLKVLPVGVGRVTLAPVTSHIKQLYCISTSTSESSYDMKLLTDSGEVLLIMEEFKVYRTDNTLRHSAVPKLYKIGFEKYEPPKKTRIQEDFNFLFIACENEVVLFEGFMNAASNITTRPVKAVRISHGTDTKEIQENVNTIIDENQGHLIVVNLLPVFAENKSDVEYVIQSEKETVVRCLEVLKALCKMKMRKATFGVVTTNSLTWKSDNVQNSNQPIAATIFGLARTAMLEQSSVRMMCADINPQLTPTEYSKVLQFFCSEDGDNEILVRNNNYLSPRIKQFESMRDSEDEGCLKIFSTASSESSSRSKYVSYSPVTQRFSIKLDTLVPPLSLDEVEMKVSYISSFSSDTAPLLDNIKTKNATPLLKFAIGHVSRVGGKAKEVFTPGSNVMACFKSITIPTSLRLNADQVALLPSTMAAHHIATLLPPLVNSYHILMENGFNLGTSHDSILVVLGNKGLGLSLSMVLLANALNLNVHCAGNLPAKIKDTLNVKKWSYQEITKHIHHPKPVFDFVFSPTAIGDVMMSAVSKMLKPKACFVILDCSNRDELMSVPIAKTCVCVRLNAVEASYVQLDNVHATWKHCVTLLKTSGIFSAVSALPQSIIPATNILSGAEYSSTGLQALELISIDEDVNRGRIMFHGPALDISGMKQKVSYLVVGGHRGFGLETIKWLIRRRAKFVIACGRSTLTASAKKVFKELEEENEAKIMYVQTDISAQEGIEKLESSLQECPPLAGIITSAVVYDDKLFTEIDEQSMLKVLRPKVIGTILLQNMIERMHIELDFFVLYSSAASLGNVGQTSYSAANTFLDSFAGYVTHTVGKRCLSVNWGAIRIGELERNKEVARKVENTGYGLVDPQKALDEMEKVLVTAPSLHNVIIADIDWPTFLRVAGSETIPLYQNISKDYEEQFNAQQQNNSSLAEQIHTAKNDEEKHEIVRDFVTSWLAAWSGGIEADVDLQVGLHQYGVDSTGAVGFQMQLQRQLGIPIEVLFLMQQDTNGFKLIQEILRLLAEDNDEISVEEAKEKQSYSIADSYASAEASSYVAAESVPSFSTYTDVLEKQARDTQESLLVPIYNPKEAKSYFFCVHGSHRYYGHVSPIAAGFKHQEVFGMYAFGFSDPTRVSEDWCSIRNLALQYVKEIRSIQPEGPYYLGGYSVGGLIALEIATIFLEEQEPVGLLVMIDTFPWVPEARGNTKKLRDAGSFGSDKVKNLMFSSYVDDVLKRIAVTRLGMQREYFHERLASDGRDHVIEELAKLANEKGVEIPNIHNLYESMTRNYSIAQKASEKWNPGKKLFRGPILYLAAQDQTFSTNTPGTLSNQEMWKACLGGKVYVLECPGNHYSIITEPINAKNIGHSIVAAATLSLKNMRPYKIRDQLTNFKKSKLLMLKQHGLSVGVFEWKEGMTSATARLGKLRVNGDETMLTFKAEQSKHTLQKRGYFQVKVKNILLVSRNPIAMDILVKSPLQTTSATYAVISMKTKHHNTEIVFSCRDDLVTFAQALEVILKMTLPIV